MTTKRPVAQKALDQDVALVRERSKDLLGGQYRVEVAAAIAEFGDDWWTKSELVDKLRSRAVPESCVNKELLLFVKWDLVRRHSKTDNGSYQYSRANVRFFWDFVLLLTESQLRIAPPQNVRRLPRTANVATTSETEAGVTNATGHGQPSE